MRRKTEAPSQRQLEILEFLKSFMAKTGYPPSVRQIGEAVGLSSSSTVHSHLSALERKGYLRREGNEARALVLLDPKKAGKPLPVQPPKLRAVGAAGPTSAQNANDRASQGISDPLRNVIQLPVLGRVAAGAPILAEQNIEETLTLPTQIVGDSSSFMLTVRGESMIEVGILDGDYVVVKEQPTANNGDIVVALIEDEATVKTFYKESDRIRLQPENASMEPIYVRDVQILGRVVALLRTI